MPNSSTPVDIVDEILIADVVALPWEASRWRRFKVGLVRNRKAAQSALLTSGCR
jgi:hypothetical protein